MDELVIETIDITSEINAHSHPFKLYTLGLNFTVPVNDLVATAIVQRLDISR